MRVGDVVEAQPASCKRLLKYSLVLLTAIIVAQALFMGLHSAYCEYKYVIYEPRIITSGEIPLDQIRPRSLDLTYRLEAGNRYHIFLVGGWVSNETDATDYDIWVYNKNGIMSRHTESAGLPEQVGNDAKNQYFLPPETGDYTFRIINDPKDSGGADPAVFMVIQHIEMNRRYSLELVGKYNPNDQYTSKAYHAFEFDTASEDFELFVNVPDSLDMYEARVYPMANPSAQVGYYIRGIGVPTGDLLTSETAVGSYGGYNYKYEKFRFSQWTASCERNGYDMDVTFGAPLHNETELVLEDRTVFYYLVLMAEYDQGTIQFYLKTDSRNPVVTLVDPNVLGYTDRSTRIEAKVSAYNPLDRVWINYTSDDWATQSSVDMQKDGDIYYGYIPKQILNKVMKYRVYAKDEIENQGSASSTFEVKDRVTPELTLNRISLYGGESLTFYGATNLANKDYILRVQGGGQSKDFTLKADTVGHMEHTYKPPAAGAYTASLLFPGDAVNHPALSNTQEFIVTKQELTVTCSLSLNPGKENRPLTISGSVSPIMSDVPVNLVLVTPMTSYVKSLTTGVSGRFSTTITTDSLGTWDILPQVLSTAYNEASQGDLISFEVVPLTIPEIVMLKAAEFTEPPLVFLPAGLLVATVAGVELKTGFIRGVIKNGKGTEEDEEEDKSEEIESDEETFTYRRRSARGA